MFLSVMTFIIIGPMIVISGIVALIKELSNIGKGNNQSQSNQSKYNIRYETLEEEERRINEWGYDDERWGRLWFLYISGLLLWLYLPFFVYLILDNL